jgi:hypothetical protein
VFFKPVPPPYDPLEWQTKSLADKSRMVCAAWAMQGYGTPLGVYAVYALKVIAYVWGWLYFCRFTPGLGRLSNFDVWWLAPVAFEKAILWSMLFEILGLGCGSGPLTGRYVPPLGGALYFLRPGTTKLPVFEGAPLIGGCRRTWLDVTLYAATLALLVRALTSPLPPREVLVGIALLVPVLGVLDKTLFLCARSEHYWTTIVVFAMTPGFVPGAKIVQCALWFWAGVSKLNHHFPAVVGVMTSNSPILRARWMRRLMYRRYPEDLAPSRLAAILGHAGTGVEIGIPIVLLSSHGGTGLWVGIAMMLFLHAYITSNVPMGVPLEWNVMMVYGALFLFVGHQGESVFDVGAPALAFLAVMCGAVPLLGNLFPSRVPFLLAMRYYAGNWAYSVWLFRGESHEKLEKLTKSAGWVYRQLEYLYDHATSIGIVSKVMGFRLMHLHGRALCRLVPRALPDGASPGEYEWIDGEIVAGMALGWNFGDGHLHGEQLLRALQSQCDFDEGELRCVMVESQPMGKATLHYRIFDAKTGLLEQGDVAVKELRHQQPWAFEAR